MKNELVYRLPDAYAKPIRGRETETAANTWRLFQIAERKADELQTEIAALYDMLDIANCTGDALARLGEMYGCSRGTESDDSIYRAEILAKIASYFSGTSANSVLRSIALACGLEVGELYLKETASAMVQLCIASLDVLDKLPFSMQKLRSIICDLLAVGVGLEDEILVNGTFRYCSAGEETSAAYDGTGYSEGTFGKAIKTEGTS